MRRYTSPSPVVQCHALPMVLAVGVLACACKCGDSVRAADAPATRPGDVPRYALKVGQELDLDEIEHEPRRGPGRPRKYPRE